LKIDPEKEVARVCRFIQEQNLALRREGAVVGLSGGVDSAVCAALCVQTLGMERVLGLILPEKESNPVSVRYAEKQARKLGIQWKIEDITPVLEAFGTYDRRDQAVREVFPDFGPGWKSKIALPGDLIDRDALNVFRLIVRDQDGKVREARLRKAVLNAVVAATDTKQRTRMMHLYYHAERRNFFVCGTTNRSEIIQGFFVKYGDGGVDIEPVGHLYKTQVYQLAEHLGVIREIRERMPSPDTFSFEVSDEEFFFRMPYETLDILLFAWENQVPLEKVCAALGLEEKQVRRAFRDFRSKKRATEHLRKLPPSLLGKALMDTDGS